MNFFKFKLKYQVQVQKRGVDNVSWSTSWAESTRLPFGRGVSGASWGGIITSTVMGVDNRWAWATPVYVSDTDGHQGQSLNNDVAETDFVNSNYDGKL